MNNTIIEIRYILDGINRLEEARSRRMNQCSGEQNNGK